MALAGEGNFLPDGLPADRIGIYEFEPNLIRRADFENHSWWTVTGIIGTCQRIAAHVRAGYDAQIREAREAGRPPPVLPMLAGWCHYYDGAVIWVREFRRVAEADR